MTVRANVKKRFRAIAGGANPFVVRVPAEFLVPRLRLGFPARRDRRGSASNTGELPDKNDYGRRTLPRVAFPGRAWERGCVDADACRGHDRFLNANSIDDRATLRKGVRAGISPARP